MLPRGCRFESRLGRKWWALLLRQELRQSFLDPPWPKIMPCLVKIRLQKCLCESDFKSLCTIYYKNACLCVFLKLWMISIHCLGLKNEFCSMQKPHLVNINMILWPKLAKKAIGNWNFGKILYIFFQISIILAYPLTTCPLLRAKKGFST